MRTRRLLCTALLAIAAAAAQPAFEVASIRVNPGPWKVLRGYSASGTAINLEGYTVADLILEAYSLESHQLDIAPAFFTRNGESVVYNIAAKAPGLTEPTRAQVREMMQQLLADRFQLRFRRESRDLPVYALVPGKSGPKLKPASPDAPRASNHRVRGRNQTIEVTHLTMDALARELRGFVGRPVIDKTGLAGEYEVTLEATPAFRLTNPQPGDIDARDAVEDTLGLRLEQQKVPIPVLVVENVNPPSEN